MMLLNRIAIHLENIAMKCIPSQSHFYSGNFLKVNPFRRSLALYVRDPRVGNYRVSTCVASRVSRRYHYKPIKSYYQHVYDHTVIVVLAMSAHVVKHQSYYLFIPVKPTQVHAGMLLSNQIL